MKVLFSIDKSARSVSDVLDCEELIIRKTDDNNSHEYAQRIDAVRKSAKLSFLPLPFAILKYVCTTVSGLLILGIAKGLRTTTLAEGFHNAPVLFYILACTLPLSLFFVIWDMILRKKYKSGREYTEAENQVDEMFADFSEELGIPHDAQELNIICISYKVKNGKLKILPTGLSDGIPFNVRLFTEGDMLCFAGADYVYGIRRDEIKGLRREDTSFSLGQWTKEKQPSEYKDFKLTVNSFDQVFIRWYYIMDIEHDGEQYLVYFPSYERDVLKEFFPDVE